MFLFFTDVYNFSIGWGEKMNTTRDRALTLTAEAYALPEEIKSDVEPSYALLYGKKTRITTYSKGSHAGLLKLIVKRRQRRFQNQFFTLLNALQQWGNNNECKSVQDQEKFATIKSQFFTPEYSGNQANLYFEDIKNSLEKIWFLLNNTNISIDKRKQYFKSLVKQFDVCAPGLHTHIEDIYYGLNQDISIERWLGELRRNIIRCFSDLHITRQHISNGNSIHVFSSFLRYAKNQGWNPLCKIENNQDAFASHARIDDSIEEFHQYFIVEYNRAAILNCLVTNLISELHNIRSDLKLKLLNSQGWFAYDKKYIDRCHIVLKGLGLKIESDALFEINDSFTEIQVSNNKIKAALLHTTKLQRLFKNFQFIEIENSIYFLTDYIPAADNKIEPKEIPMEIVRWTALPIGVCGALLGAVLNSLSVDKVKEFIIALNDTILQTIVKSGMQLGRLFSQLKTKHNWDSEKWTIVLATCKELNNDGKLHFIVDDERLFSEQCSLLAQFPAKDWLYVNEILYPKHNLFLNAIQCRNLKTATEWITEAKIIPEEQVDEHSNNALHYAAKKGYASIFNWLFANTKIGINTQNSDGDTALHLASKHFHQTAVALLLEKDVNLSIKNKSSQTAFDIILDHINQHVGTDLAQRIMKLFINAINQEVKKGLSISVALEYFSNKISAKMLKDLFCDNYIAKQINSLKELVLLLDKLDQESCNYNQLIDLIGYAKLVNILDTKKKIATICSYLTPEDSVRLSKLLRKLISCQIKPNSTDHKILFRKKIKQIEGHIRPLSGSHVLFWEQRGKNEIIDIKNNTLVATLPRYLPGEGYSEEKHYSCMEDSIAELPDGRIACCYRLYSPTFNPDHAKTILINPQTNEMQVLDEHGCDKIVVLSDTVFACLNFKMINIYQLKKGELPTLMDTITLQEKESGFYGIAMISHNEFAVLMYPYSIAFYQRGFNKKLVKTDLIKQSFDVSLDKFKFYYLKSRKELLFIQDAGSLMKERTKSDNSGLIIDILNVVKKDGIKRIVLEAPLKDKHDFHVCPDEKTIIFSQLYRKKRFHIFDLETKIFHKNIPCHGEYNKYGVSRFLATGEILIFDDNQYKRNMSMFMPEHLVNLEKQLIYRTLNSVMQDVGIKMPQPVIDNIAEFVGNDIHYSAQRFFPGLSKQKHMRIEAEEKPLAKTIAKAKKIRI